MRSVVLLASLLVLGCTVPVQHGLDEPAANEVVTALERAGIGAEKAKDEATAGAFTVEVARGDGARAMELMRALGLPRGRRNGFAETYGQPSLVPTPTEEKARYVEALGSEVERTLETIDGVVSARVHLVLAETDPLAVDGKPRVPAQAAVLLKTRANGAPPLKESDVQRLVAGSVPGLQPAAVAVVVTAAPEPAAGTTPALTPVGPLRVSPGTKPVLLAALGLGLLLLAGLAGALLVISRRLARLQRHLPARFGEVEER